MNTYTNYIMNHTHYESYMNVGDDDVEQLGDRTTRPAVRWRRATYVVTSETLIILRGLVITDAEV